MDKEVLISVITVTYNAADTVGRTLGSVAEQSFDNYEHIIVDGSSSDGTLSVIAAAPGATRRRVQSEPDSGIYDAMNKGIGLSRGTYLLFLNAGDRLHSPDTLRQIADTVIRENYPGVVYGQTDLVDDGGRYLGPRHLTAPVRLQYTDFARGMVVCHQSFVALKRIVPLFDTRYRFSADYDWCIQCLQHSRRNAYTGTVITDYLAEGVTTANRRASLRERFTIMSYYYGLWPTVFRHMGFVFRFLRHKRRLDRARR